MRRYAMAAVLTVLAIGCDSPPTKEKCGQLTSHMFKLSMEGAVAKEKLTDSEKKKLLKNLERDKVLRQAKAPDSSLNKECTKTGSKKKAECVLAAATLDKAKKCEADWTKVEVLVTEKKAEYICRSKQSKKLEGRCTTKLN